MTITKKQRTICIIYAFVISVIILFPPVQRYLLGRYWDGGYRFIGFSGSMKINTTALLLEILVATIVFGMFIFLDSVKISDKKENK